MPSSASRATLVFLHHLGGSAETWKPVEDRLQSRFPCVRLDLPGFGAASGEAGRSVGGMADWVEDQVTRRVSGPWVLIGHSMSAKIALLLARRHEDSPASGAPLAGLVLAAGSPPAPEPMQETKRQEMLGWFAGDAKQSRSEADGFVSANVSTALERTAHETAVTDVLRTSRQAWHAWLTSGSLEDLRDTVGRVDVPALVLAGADDEALGQQIQREQVLPHLCSATFEVVDGAAHLLPMEQPDRVAELVASFADKLGLGGAAAADDTSNRMTTRTRTLLNRRGAADHAYAPKVLDETGLATLRRLLQQLLPMPDGVVIDLAAKLDSKLDEAVGDGWRFASLPPDAEAYRRALSALDTVARRERGEAFATLDDDVVDAIMNRLGDGTLALGDGFLSGTALRDWFGEVRGDCCQIFLTHPAIEARADILAAATGGDAALRGFSTLDAGRSEAWERAFWLEQA